MQLLLQQGFCEGGNVSRRHRPRDRELFEIPRPARGLVRSRSLHCADSDRGDAVQDEFFEVRKHVAELEDWIDHEERDAVELECAHVREPLPQAISLES